MRCGNTWESKSSYRPKRCPACSTRQWDVAQDTGEPESFEVSEVEDDVMREYRKGSGCLDISLALGIPYSVVRGIVIKRSPGATPRVR